MADSRKRGLGVAAGLDPEDARPLASRCAELGYDSMWSAAIFAAGAIVAWVLLPAAAPALEPGVAVQLAFAH